MKEFGKIQLIIRPTPEEVKEEIQDVLEPLLAVGQMSTSTLLRAANLDWETELQHKKLEEPYRELFSPPVTFTQQAIRQDGTETETSSPRRGQTQTDRRKVKRQLEASVLGQEADEEDDRAKKLYREWLAMAWALAAYEAEQAGVATAQLRAAIADYMTRAGVLGYKAVGGEKEAPDESWMRRGIRFMQSHVDDLEQDWGSMTPARLQWRLGLYAQEGMRIGYVMGAQQAAEEVHQAAFWQRILHQSCPNLDRAYSVKRTAFISTVSKSHSSSTIHRVSVVPRA